jgi:hypothetical protein
MRKVGNLHVASAGALIVLDWEFAWSGSRPMDVGQLLRWKPPEPFVRAFAGAYRDGGGALPDGWRRIAAAIEGGWSIKRPTARDRPPPLHRHDDAIMRYTLLLPRSLVAACFLGLGPRALTR